MNTGQTSKSVDSEFILGMYDAEESEAYPREEEIYHVVNATESLGDGNYGGSSSQPAAGAHRGNGAFYKQEYTGGDVCDDTDVTDAAIKAGNAGEDLIHRSTTVRFFCGQQLAIAGINEDSTCHYILEVTVPDLCYHPLFKAPTAKKQVMKCLPVQESHTI